MNGNAQDAEKGGGPGMTPAENQTIYLIKPQMAGLANTLQVSREDGTPIYFVRSRILGVPGRSYTVLGEQMQEYMTTLQHHTALFPRHTVLHGEDPVAKLGQERVVPLTYYIHYFHRPRMTIRFGVFDSIYALTEDESGKAVAEIAQHRSTWIVALRNDDEPSHILPMLAVVYRETTIGW